MTDIEHFDIERKLVETGLFDEPFPCTNTLRIWHGPCAITGKTAQWFYEQLKDVNVSLQAKRSAIKICRSYGINGLCDPGYIANNIEREIKL